MTVSVIAEAAIYPCLSSSDLILNNTITYWGNSGRFDVVLGAFTGKCLREGNETHLGSTVVGLSEIACILRKKKGKYSSGRQHIPYRPAALAVLMTRPNFCLRNSGQAALVQEKAPFK
jgi:hypothetical protein